MKAGTKRKGKAAEVMLLGTATSICTVSKKSVKRPNGQFGRLAGQQKEQILVERDQNTYPHSEAPQFPKNHALCSEKTTITSVNLNVGKTLSRSAKIKLQLFPIDENTRIGLEKDGYLPYLELTLHVRKKISSVIKHFNSKWGTSAAASGEPVLFPFNLCPHSIGSQRKWTVSDTDTNAGDVYVGLGSPEVFRLRYGWLCNEEPKSHGMPSTMIPFETCSQYEEVPKVASTCIDNIDEKQKQLFGTCLNIQQNCGTDETYTTISETKSLGAPRNTVASISGQSPVPWDDSLTNISIGTLLSEASKQGKFSNYDPAPCAGHLGFQPSQFITASLDAFFSKQVNRSQSPIPVCHVSQTSILDSEETCHAFSVQRSSPVCTDAQAIDRRTNVGTDILNEVSKSTRFPNFFEVKLQTGAPQDYACPETDTNLSLCSPLYNDERSLGLRNIKWTDDSLGPFDSGLPSVRKINDTFIS